MWAFLLAVAVAADPAADALGRGIAAQRAGRVQEAVAAYERCLALEASNVACWWELGWSRWTLADFDGAAKAWTEVKRLEPAHPEVDRWLGQARENAVKLAAIRGAYENAPATVEPTRAPKGRTLRLRAVGDVMLGSDFPTPELPPEDGAQLLAPVADLLRDADLTFGNLEGPLCDGGTTRKCRPDSTACYAFRTPTRYARWLQEAGFDLLSTANNHSGDFGEECRRQTEAALDAVGIAWSGPPGTVASVTHEGRKVAMVAFHTSPACNWLNDHEAAAALVRHAAATHDFVVVSFHGGAEGARAVRVPDGPELFHGEDRGHLRAFARVVVGAGADVVFGHGPHVLRGLEVIDGHLVAYSLGNFATYGRFNLSGLLGVSAVLEVVLDEDGKLVEGRILPVKQVGAGEPVPDPDGQAIGLLRQLSLEDFGDAAPVIGRDGRFAPPRDR